MTSRVFPVFFAVVSLGFILAACAPSPPPHGDRVRAEDLSRNNPPDCACTLEYRMNLCATVNGSDTIPGSLSFLRERRPGGVDSLYPAETRCFGEWRGEQRLLMLHAGPKGRAVIDSSPWFTIRTVDCCHGEAKTVDFRR